MNFSTNNQHMTFTPAMLIQWLSETGRYDATTESFNWRDLKDDEKVAFISWAEQHLPDKWEQDGEKSL